MPLTYEITGYDARTGRLTHEYNVPDRRVATVKKIAGISPADDGLGSYPLDNDQVDEIARVLETSIEQDGCDFFLEPHEQSKNAAVG